jgi:hypothetical protein
MFCLREKVINHIINVTEGIFDSYAIKGGYEIALGDLERLFESCLIQ